LEKQDAAELTVDELVMQRFIQTRDCRRFAMSGYLDEEGQTCEEIDRQLCDCDGGGVADWSARQVRAAQELQEFEEQMNEVQLGHIWAKPGRVFYEPMHADGRAECGGKLEAPGRGLV
jgi:hypothetical protein